ncbi:MAG: hypothetical protein PHU71_04930, partial [Candidatus Gracilibacteria bacterium]|nr:hypothetical protein [Candidatus Gracilibacteria bacterium]
YGDVLEITLPAASSGAFLGWNADADALENKTDPSSLPAATDEAILYGSGTAWAVGSVDGTTVELVSGVLGIKDGGVDTTQLAADAIDGTKIADDAVDTEHIADDAVEAAQIADNAVGTAAITTTLAYGLTGKDTLVLADSVFIVDSEDSNVNKKATLTSIQTLIGSGIFGYIKVSEVKPNDTQGGTFTSGAWRTRTINTEDSDTGSHCSISNNQITLAAGTYECYISAPALSVDGHKARLYNITDAETTLFGTTSRSANTITAMTNSTIVGRFTIATSKVFEIQHLCGATKTNTGFGEAANIGLDEVYTVAEFRKVE